MPINATALDLQNAFVPFAKQVLGFSDRQKQGMADMELQNERLRLNRESTRFLQELEQDGDYDNYLEKLKKFRSDYHAGVNKRDDSNAKLRKSNYFFKEMDRMLIENKDLMEAQVRARQNGAAHSAGRALLNKNLNEALEMYKDDPQTYIHVAHELISPAVKNGFISYAESLQFKDSAFRTALGNDIERQVMSQWQQGKTINDLDEIFAGIDLSKYEEFSLSPIRNESNKQYAERLRAKQNLNGNESAWLRAYEGDSEDDTRYAQELMAKENLTGEEEAWIAGYQGRSGDDTEGYEEKLVINPDRLDAIKKSKMDWARQTWNTVVTAKRRETDSQISVTYGKVLTAVTEGNPNAVGMIRAGLDEVARFSNLYIDPDDRNKYNKWYNDMLKAVTDGTAGRSVSREMVDEIKNSRDYWLNSGAAGRSSMEEARTAYMQEMGEKAREAGFENIDEFERRYSKEIDFFGMYEDMKKTLIEKNAGYADAFKNLDNFINRWKTEGKAKDDLQLQMLRESQGKRIGKYFFDTILDSYGDARITPEQMEQETLRLTGLLIGDKINFPRETNDNSNRFTGGQDDEAFGRAIHEMEQHPWARFIVNGEVYTFGDQQYQRDIEEAARDKFKTITGIPLASLNIGHSKEGQHDEAAELNIIVSGRGTEEDGRYRFKADAGGNYWIERWTDERWQRDSRYTETAKQVKDRLWDEASERHGEANRQADQEKAQRGMLTTFELIRNETDIDRRGIIARTSQSTIPRDEFWKAGIHPDSGDPNIKEIPARDWERILNMMGPSERKAQEEEWQRLGVTKGGGR